MIWNEVKNKLYVNVGFVKNKFVPLRTILNT